MDPAPPALVRGSFIVLEGSLVAQLGEAAIEGARANGLEAKVGTLTPGKEADLILLRTDRVNVMPINDPIGAGVWGMDTSNVDTVFVAGKPLKRDGQLVNVDLRAVMRMVTESRDYVVRKSRFRLPAI